MQRYMSAFNCIILMHGPSVIQSIAVWRSYTIVRQPSLVPRSQSIRRRCETFSGPYRSAFNSLVLYIRDSYTASRWRGESDGTLVDNTIYFMTDLYWTASSFDPLAPFSRRRVQMVVCFFADAQRGLLATRKLRTELWYGLPSPPPPPPLPLRKAWSSPLVLVPSFRVYDSIAMFCLWTVFLNYCFVWNSIMWLYWRSST